MFSNTGWNNKVGLCPPPARVGDNIVVLDGGSVPYPIRLKDREGTEVKSGTKYESSESVI